MLTGKGVGSWVSCLCDSEESVMASKEWDEVKVNWGHLTLILLPQLWGGGELRGGVTWGKECTVQTGGRCGSLGETSRNREEKKVILGFKQWAVPFMLPQWSCMRWDAFIVLMFFFFWVLSFIWLQVSLIFQSMYMKSYVRHKVCNIMLWTCNIFHL